MLEILEMIETCQVTQILPEVSLLIIIFVTMSCVCLSHMEFN